MKRTRRKIELTEEGKRLVAGIAAGAAILVILLFVLLFRVTNVKVLGSTKYSDSEIKEYVMEGPLTWNTVLVSLFKNHIEAENLPFIESFDLEALDWHTIRIHVNEKQLVGYVIQDMDKMYFDKDGFVVEKTALTEEEIAQLEADTEELQALQLEEEQRLQAEQEAAEGDETDSTETEDGQSEETDSAEDDQDDIDNGASIEGEDAETDSAQTLQPEEVDYGNENATEFHAAVTDVPRIVGLEMTNVELDQQIEVEDSSVFNTILGITRIVEKYEILPEIVYFDKDLEITLVYNQGTIHCQLGKDSLLEEKITRVAAILPNLSDKTGILHLEDYTTDTTNIIFSQESLYTLKSKINAIFQKNS